MTVLRRLDDAACALVHGHSRRDLDRSRRRRARLLADRLVAMRLRRFAEAEARHARWPGLFEEMHLFTRTDLQTALDLRDGLLQGSHGAVCAVLIDELMIDRLWVHANKMRGGAEIDLMECRDKGFVDDLKAELRASQKGKLYEGLLEYGRLHALQYKLGVCIGHFGSFLVRAAGALASPYWIHGIRHSATSSQDADGVLPAGPDGRTSSKTSGPALSGVP